VKQLFSKDDLKKILLRENELRLSEGVQKRYAEAEESGVRDWMMVTEKVQEEMLANDFGVKPRDMQAALLALRTATQRYPEFASIPLYVKYNRARHGNLKCGDAVPDVPLVSPSFTGSGEGKLTTTLYSVMKQQPNVPWCIFAGSRT